MSNLCQGPGPDCKGMLQERCHTSVSTGRRGTPENTGEHLHPSALEIVLHHKNEVLQLLLLNRHLLLPPFPPQRSMLKCIHTGQGILSCSFTSQQAVPLLSLEHARGTGREHGPVARNEALLSYIP